MRTEVGGGVENEELRMKKGKVKDKRKAEVKVQAKE